MAEIKRAIVAGQIIRLDGGTFKGYEFHDCTFLYSGGELIFNDNVIHNCNITLDGPAARTFGMIRMLAHGGGAELVQESIFGKDELRRIH